MDTTLVVGVVVTAATALLAYGLPLFLAEYFPWQLLWAQRSGRPTVTTASYGGRTAMVTGANGAYGSRAATLFAQHGIGTLVLVDVHDCADVKRQIEAGLRAEGKPVPTILVWQIDMMTFSGCQALAAKARTLQHLDHVLLTAGILAFHRRESPEDWETSIQVNFLSTALIALLLLPLLKSSPGNPEPPVLTFTTSFGVYPSSFTMGLPRSPHASYLKRLSSNRDGMEQAHQYGRSKALLLYFARELAARIANANYAGRIGRVTITSADPGSAWTPLTNPNQSKLIPRLIMNISARDPLIGATALVNGASAPGSAHGEILHDFDAVSYPPFMNRPSGRIAQQRVWEEARREFEAKVPEVAAVFGTLDEE
ncbi:short chain dehydrogenase reductase [Grosmannia clavigera kw1407]|uniref:Short chain dehydrogenase reductase n=1 Tax=Grosmannia clavigera (strain kw1407 / UAMH 11150) TaxID=655863 RepID=F0XEF6_GROCL|nr:short chain dehydrogenase reductase [Grosmannia clavigera kw1407]EFX03916.1 short chain dehydrogenase reductase [Grosmannia clavigera kw1407]